ncbi:MAG: hypothetical protein WCF25_05505 [Acidimicrobiales bacterium]
MNEFDERLRAADPAAASSYDHPDANAMISRIMTTAPRARRHVLRSFQLRMAGSVAIAAALTVGGIAALDGAAPSLSVFALAAAKSSPHASYSIATTTPSRFRGGPMRLLLDYDFSAGPDLSTTPGSGAAYELTLPTSASAEASRIAGIFNVSGSPVDVNSDGQDFTVTDPSGNFVEYETYDTVPQWSYSVAIPSAPGTDSTTTDGVTVAMPSQATVEADVQGYLSQLGYNYQVTDPQFTTSNNVVTSPGQPTVTTNEEQATFSVTVDGQLTDQYLDFTVDQNNNVVSADGPAFTAAPAVNYPLQSAAAGVGVLEAQQQAEFSGNGDSTGTGSGSGSSVTPTNTTGPASPPASTPGVNDTTTTSDPTTSTTIPVVDVTLDAETVSYATFQLTDGSVWMLPIYNYTGLVTNADGSSYTGTWSTIAVDPTYIQVPTSSSGGINPGGPILY